MQTHFENAKERYFVGPDGSAFVVNKEFFASFRISSSEFYQTCGASWRDEVELDKIMSELINCHVEITFREWCGFKYRYYVSSCSHHRNHQWRRDGEQYWYRSSDRKDWIPVSRERVSGIGLITTSPWWIYEITEDEANGTGHCALNARDRECKAGGKPSSEKLKARHLIGIRDSEIWPVDEEFDSMEDAVEALDSGDYDDELFGENDIDEEYRDMHAAIGIKVDVVPQEAICADDIIEKMQEHADEIAGDAAGDFLSRKSVAGKSGDLEAAVRIAISDWLTRNNLWPTFYGVDQIVSLGDAKRILNSIAIDNGGVGR